MKTLIALLLLIVISQAFKLEFPKDDDKVIGTGTLPAFIGKGYHALRGNPYTHRVDEGFRSPIFELTYEQKRTTEDGQFLIPDYTHASQTIACTLNSKVASYSGTESYQKELSNIVSFDKRYEGTVMNAKFSFSLAFSTFYNNTVSKTQTSCISNAECTVYTLDMPIFSNQMVLTKDFIDGVKQSYANNQWQEFLQHFGSHYATNVVFGGRYVLEHTYAEESISLFKSMKLDLNIAAQMQFFSSAQIPINEKYKQYVNQTKVINSKVESTQLSTIGGLPPKSGVWTDWVSTVKANLAPISCKLSAVTILFNYIPTLDATAAIKSFNTYFNYYCSYNPCPNITPDRPEPKELTPVFTLGPEFQGAQPAPLPFNSDDGLITVGMRATKFMFGFYYHLESFQIILSNGINQHALTHIGNTRNLSKTYIVPEGDEIKCIRFGVYPVDAFHNRLYSLQFTTKLGAESPVFTGIGPISQYHIACTDTFDQHIVGLHGTYNVTSSGIDSIGLNFMREVIKP